MSALQIVLLVLAALVVAGLAFIVIQYLTFRRGVHYAKPVTVNGIGFIIQVHYRSKLTRWLNVQGFAMGGHAWIFAPLDLASREVVAHEVIHLVREHLVGKTRYFLLAFWEWATQWVWRRRSTEEEARRGQGPLARTGTATIEVVGHQRLVSAPWLLDLTQP